MDEIAEKGVAAHWAYKEGHGQTQSRKSIEDIVSSKLRWYSELIRYTEESDSEEEILNIFTDDILNANVYVFTPNGDIIDLTAGATPIDFAFRIHTRLGEKTVGAIVNGKIQPLDYTLKTGDMVEIRTSQNAVGPNENWLKIAKTSNARSKIKNFLNKQKRDVLVEQGRDDFEERSSPGICRSRFLTNLSPICSPIKVSRRLRTSILRLGRTSFPRSAP